MNFNIPKLPEPRVIQDEIARLKARIGELRTPVPLAEVQYVNAKLDGAHRGPGAKRRKRVGGAS